MPTTPSTTAELHRLEQLAQVRWTGMILAFFVVQAILWIAAIALTHNDDSHAVVAGYDEQALRWDQTRQAQIESDRLGWAASITFEDPGLPAATRMISAAVTDKDGQLVSGLDISLNAFHLGHAAKIQTLILSEQSPGRYFAAIEIRQSGKWRLSGVAILDDARFQFEQTHFVDVSGVEAR